MGNPRVVNPDGSEIDDLAKKLIDQHGIDSVINTPIDPDTMDIDEIFARERVQGQDWLEKNTVPKDPSPTKKANSGLSDAEIEKLQADYDEFKTKHHAYLDELGTVKEKDGVPWDQLSRKEQEDIMQELKYKHGVDKAPPPPAPAPAPATAPASQPVAPAPQSGSPAGDVVIKDGNGNVVQQSGVDANATSRNTRPVGRRVDPNPQSARERPTVRMNSQSATQSSSGGAQAKIVTGTNATTTTAASTGSNVAPPSSTARKSATVLSDMSQAVTKGFKGSKNLRVAAAAAVLGGGGALLGMSRGRQQRVEDMERRRVEMQRRGVIS